MGKLLYFLLMVPALCGAQNLQLPEPNIQQLQQKVVEEEHQYDVIYEYLRANFKPFAAKTDTAYLAYKPHFICAFTQRFIPNIIYSTEHCREASGISTTIILPTTDHEEIVQWVELMYEAELTNIPNTWNKSETVYEPEEGGAGCSYELKENKNQTTVEVYCGC